MRPAKIQIRAVWSESSLGAFWTAKEARLPRADNKDWLEYADAQTDLSLHWAHIFKGTFPDVADLNFIKKGLCKFRSGGAHLMTIITNHYLLFKSESDSEFELISLTLRITFFIASTARARSLDGRDYDQGKVTYNDIYFQQKSPWPIFFLFLPWSCHRKLAEQTGADLIISLFTKFGSH